MPRIEIPARLFSDGLCAATWAVLGIALAASFSSNGYDMPLQVAALTAMAGVGVLLQRRAARYRPRSVTLAADGLLTVTSADGCPVEARIGQGTRVVGRSLYLVWTHPAAAGTGQQLWLTPVDVPAGQLRRFLVVLRCSLGLQDM